MSETKFLCSNCSCKISSTKVNKQLLKDGKKCCRVCEVIKDISEFHLHCPSKSQTRRRPDCKDCQQKRNKDLYQLRKAQGKTQKYYLEKQKKKKSKEINIQL